MILIEKEPIMKFIQDGLNNKHYGYVGVEIITEVEYAPEIDAVPVVRCKDCKYAHSGNGIWYWCGTDERKRPSSFYCSAGRKKDEYDDKP